MKQTMEFFGIVLKHYH